MGHEPKRVLPRRSFIKQTECFLRIVQEMGGHRLLMVLRVSLINRGLNSVFAWDVRGKYSACEGNWRTTVVLLSIERMDMEKRSNQDPCYHPRQEKKAEGRGMNQFVHDFP